VRKEKDPGLPPQFAKVLEQFAVSPAELDTELTVAPGTVVTLSAHPRHASHRRPKLLQTSDLDQLKRWIGVPDEVVKGRCLLDREEREALTAARRAVAKEAGQAGEQVVAGTLSRYAAPVAKQAAEGVEAVTEAPVPRADAIRAHARAYLYGDSSLVANARPSLMKHFDIFIVPVWHFLKVKVSSGSVLLFGPGANVLLAQELEIEEGGQIVSLGPLTVRVATLRKTMPSIVATPLQLKHVLKLLRA